MRVEYIVPIVIGILQLVLLLVTFDLKAAFKRMINAFNHSAVQEDKQLNNRILRIVSQLRKTDEYKEAQDIFTGQSAAQVVEQITEALEAITLAKNKDVKIIISNDNTIQECFEIKLSYRLDDQV